MEMRLRGGRYEKGFRLENFLEFGVGCFGLDLL